MSPRANRRRRDDGGRAPGVNQRTVFRRAEEADDGDWVIRPVSGAASGKAYRCPGCDQEIRPATPHLVTWPTYDVDAASRRHWHTACWAARARRGVKVHRAKNAPRHG